MTVFKTYCTNYTFVKWVTCSTIVLLIFLLASQGPQCESLCWLGSCRHIVVWLWLALIATQLGAVIDWCGTNSNCTIVSVHAWITKFQNVRQETVVVFQNKAHQGMHCPYCDAECHAHDTAVDAEPHAAVAAGLHTRLEDRQLVVSRSHVSARAILKQGQSGPAHRGSCATTRNGCAYVNDQAQGTVIPNILHPNMLQHVFNIETMLDNVVCSASSFCWPDAKLSSAWM